ncbi:MAG: hypothetical protein JW983_04415 [Elusimicrobia bacterium]|nr:hypothetical protein [Elusimicrobiota bacterium]
MLKINKLFMILTVLLLCSDMVFGKWKDLKNLEVAVSEFVSNVEDEKIDTVTLTEMLQTSLVNRDKFIIVERTLINKLLKERSLELAGLTETEISKVGEMAGADKIISGSISKLNGKYIVIIKGMDVKKGIVEFSDQIIEDRMEDIIELIPAIADRIILKAKGKKVKPYTPVVIKPAKQPVTTTALIKKGLIAYYPFNKNARDESGNNRHGQVYGAKLTKDRLGNQNSAYSFDGIDDYIYSPVNINPDVFPELTIAAWVCPDSNVPIKQIVSHDNGQGDRSFGIDYRGGGIGWSAFCAAGGVLGFKPVKVGEWTFVAVTYDQIKRKIELYVNGEKITKRGKLGRGWKHIRIGSNPSFGEYFSGDIDEVYIYNRVLSQNEINQISREK